jgi:hypothetical protein
MKKILYIYAIFVLSVYADSTISLHSKYIPKILKQDLDFEQKHSNKEIIAAIVYTDNSQKLAKSLQKKLFKSISKNLALDKIDIKLIDRCDYDSKDRYTFIYTFDDNGLDNIFRYAQRDGVVSFCYSQKDLQNGCAIHIRDNKNVEILYNKSVINDTGIIFSKSFLKVVKSYD